MLLFISISCNRNKEAEMKTEAIRLNQIAESKVTKKEQNKETEVNNSIADTAIISSQGTNASNNTKDKEQTKEEWDKKIVKTATLNIEVKDYNEFNSSLRTKIKQFGGYIAQEEQNESDYSIENKIMIKIPVDQFDNVVSELTKGDQKVNEKKINSEDVTSEFVDTKSRLEAKKQVRQRYLDLLKQAKNMEEILSVQSEINSIEEEIESASGRIQYLNHSSTFSTINLTYSQVLNASAKNPDKEPTFGYKLRDAFKTGWAWFGDLFVGVISFWPLLLILFAGVLIYKRSKKPKATQV